MFRFDNNPSTKSTNNVLGINIDADRILLVYGSLSGLVNERITLPAPTKEGFAYAVEQISEQADRLLLLTQAQRLPVPDRVSVAVAGNYDSQTGILESSPYFPEWRSISIKSQLALRFNLPVDIEHKANAGALAETFFGLGRDLSSLVYVSLSPVVRLGIINNRLLYRNPGGNAGALGEIQVSDEGPACSGLPGSLNSFASPRGMVRLALSRNPSHWNEDVDIYQIIDSAKSGDPYALDTIAEAGYCLGEGLVSVTHILRPQMVILGYPGCLLGDLLVKPAREALSQATGLTENQLPEIAASQLCSRLPELEALSPAINASRNQSPS